jgi:putative restriction endonuclease
MKSESENRAHWLGKLANLNAAKTPGLGVAPHKPLMIFSVMDLIEMRILRDRWVAYDADLVTRFRDYWDHVVVRRRNLPEITLPFNALGGERDAVWERFDEHGHPSKSKLTTRLCHLDPNLYDCLLDSGFRLAARQVLIATYFTPSEQASLCERFRLPVPDTAEMAKFAKDRESFKASQKKGRDIRFRADVDAFYRYTCALTGYCVQYTRGYIVHACHIHDHSKSGNDDPSNGLALTPDAHWMLDKGLWTAIPKGDDFIVRVALGGFTESSPYGHLLARHHGKPLHFHEEAELRPAVEHLEWHRVHRFLKSA